MSRKKAAGPRREALPPVVMVGAERRCAYEHEGETCAASVAGSAQFCKEHARAGVSAAALAEEHALGPAAAQLHRDLADMEMRMSEQEQGGTPAEAGGAAAERQATESAVAAATRLAVEMARGERPAPSAKLTRKPVVRGPEAQAMAIALQAVAEEKAELERRAAQRARPNEPSATGRAALSLTAYFPELPDMIAIDPALVKPGYIPRWVRTKDMDGKPWDGRVRLFRAWGAEDVLLKDGTPLEDRYGKAMQLPPERYAARVLATSPTGAFDDDRQTEQLMETMDAMNRQVGYRAGQLIPREGHGVRSAE